MKAALEKEIINLTSGIELYYGMFFDSIKCKKDEDGILSGFKINFVDEDFDKISAKEMNDRLNFEYQHFEAQRFEFALKIDSDKLDMPISEILSAIIFCYISNFESEHNVTFKSIKANKDKDRKLTGFTLDFDGDDIPVIESPQRIKKYHLKEPEQKIPPGFMIYDERNEVAGIQHRRDAAAQFVNQTNQWLEFESEPLNSYDSNAIKILGCYQLNDEIVKLHVGYVPASTAKQITDFSADECKARLLKTYIGESGYVEILFQVLGPKERIEEYASFYVHTDEDDEDDEDEYDDEED
jgi:hypothetical protein